MTRRGPQEAAADLPHVTDEGGVRYALTRRLGVGGQGEVWLTADQRRIVKRLHGARDPAGLRRQIAFVRRLDLRDLHVAQPIALLRPPHVGYVAEFLADMVPLRALLAPRADSVARWYRETGGLRRRLRLLAHAGEALAALHARGLVYGDVSPANVFVSERVEHHEAWLIDLDNLRHDSDPATAVYSPGYGAPELVAGRTGPSSLSDAWAFAVLAFQTLTLAHPFTDGDLVRDGEPELEDEALAGALPWIDHATDPRNRSSVGLPRGLVMPPRLLELAHRAFDASARDPLARPSIGSWVERLHAVADQTLRCAACASTFLATAPRCPWCEAERPRAFFVEIQRWEPGHGVVTAREPVGRLALSAHERLALPRRVTAAAAGVPGRSIEGWLEAVERGVRVDCEVERGWSVTLADDPLGTRKRAIPATGLRFPRGNPPCVVHFGPIDQPHRVATLWEEVRAGR